MEILEQNIFGVTNDEFLIIYKHIRTFCPLSQQSFLISLLFLFRLLPLTHDMAPNSHDDHQMDAEDPEDMFNPEDAEEEVEDDQDLEGDGLHEGSESDEGD